MSGKIVTDATTKRASEKLAKLLRECRGEQSLRKIAGQIGIAASQLQSLEEAKLTPTANVFSKLLVVLRPDEKTKKELEHLYMTIRKTPPPDVCEFIIDHPNLIPLLRSMDGMKLGKREINTIMSMITQIKEGEKNNG